MIGTVWHMPVQYVKHMIAFSYEQCLNDQADEINYWQRTSYQN